MLILPQNSSIEQNLAQQFQAVRARIANAAHAANRSEDSITLVAVSKGHAPELVRAAGRLGQEHFGENYLQEALPKIAALSGEELTWHFIGRLQANKTRPVAEHFAWVHGISRLKVAERLSSQRGHYAPPLNVCIQVNISADGSKAGVTPMQLAALAQAVMELPRLRLRGLMCMLGEDLSVNTRRAAFADVRVLLQRLQAKYPGVDTLSMGMSADFEDAILAGATMVRVGTAIFGPRA